MEYHEKLLSKNGISTIAIAKEFLACGIGSKIPTITDFIEKIGMARGTIQNSIKCLQENGAIRLVARGHLGTYLVYKNTSILLSFAGITSLVGVMPLPYSKRYEGLATGLIAAMENQYNIPSSMAYMRGATNRVSMLIANRYDFAIISGYAANDIRMKKQDIQIIKKFGAHSYLSRHIIVFHSPNDYAIKDNMRIGIDNDSIDQLELTKEACKGKNVEYINVEYNQILEKIRLGLIDAAIWNEDEIIDKTLDVNYVMLNIEDTSDTEAVMVVNSNRNDLIGLLREIIDVQTVLNVQKIVLEGKITPSY